MAPPTLAIVLISWLTQLVSAKYVPEDGDVLFQTSQTRQSAAIQAVTGSRYSHMGIVLFQNGSPYVYEAVGPVKYTPLQEWVDRGVNGHFVAKRLSTHQLSAKDVKALHKAASIYEGKPYDSLFSWSDKHIYCSELVWKMFKRTLDIEVGLVERFRNFDLTNPLAQTIIKERWGGKPPLDEPVITPAAMFDSPHLKTIFLHR